MAEHQRNCVEGFGDGGVPQGERADVAGDTCDSPGGALAAAGFQDS